MHCIPVFLICLPGTCANVLEIAYKQSRKT